MMLMERTLGDAGVVQAHARPGNQVQIMWSTREGGVGSCLMPGWVWYILNDQAMDALMDKLSNMDEARVLAMLRNR